MGYCILILSTMAMSCYEMGLMTDEVVFSLVICSKCNVLGSEENRKYIIFFLYLVLWAQTKKKQ